MRTLRLTAYNPSPMTTRRSIPAASRAGARGRGHHSLAPGHLGEATAAATVGVVVGGIALAITGLGMLAMGLTMGARLGVGPPARRWLARFGAHGARRRHPAAGWRAHRRRSRRPGRRAPFAAGCTGILSIVAAALAAAGTVLVTVNPPRDVVLAIALTAAALVYGVAAILLLRRAAETADARRSGAADAPRRRRGVARAGMRGPRRRGRRPTALLDALPPVAIDADALGGLAAFMAAGSLVVAVAHAGVAVGLARDVRWARSAGVLLASALAVTFLALAATAAASAVREVASASILSVGTVAALGVAVAYGLTAARLVAELRSASPG